MPGSATLVVQFLVNRLTTLSMPGDAASREQRRRICSRTRRQHYPCTLNPQALQGLENGVISKIEASSVLDVLKKSLCLCLSFRGVKKLCLRRLKCFKRAIQPMARVFLLEGSRNSKNGFHGPKIGFFCNLPWP